MRFEAAGDGKQRLVRCRFHAGRGHLLLGEGEYEDQGYRRSTERT